MAEPLLPELTNEATVTAFSAAGKWEARTGQNLDDVRKGLKVSAAKIQINSIPDIWARPLLFEMSLFDPSHPLHLRTVGEWRGLLALLALQSVRGITELTAVPVKIAQSANPAENTLFLDAAARLIPLTTINPGTTWDNSYIFLVHDGFRDRPIGMTSPTTLVYTSTHYFDHIKSIQWFNAEYLEDPVRHLSAIEKPALASWLNYLSSNLSALSSISGTDTTILNNLTGLIKSFIDDLGVSVIAGFQAAQTTFGISPAHGVFSYLNAPVAPPPPPPSSIRLNSTSSRRLQKPLLIVDKEISEQWGVLPKDIHVHAAKTLSDSLPLGHPDNQHNKYAGVILQEAEVWNAKEFFTNHLWLFRVPNAFPGSKEEKWVNNQRPTDLSVILPFNQKLLDYLSPEDLIQKTIFQRSAGGEITVHVTLSLGGDATGSESRNFTVTKEYRPDDFKYLDELPIVEVFPNFKVVEWRAFYLAYSASQKQDAFQIKPLLASNIVKSFEIPPDGGGGIRKLWQLDEYPDALVCQVEDRDIGVLLLSDPVLPRLQSFTYTVGIDFGASGTSVFYGKDGNNIKQLALNNHKLTVTNLTDVQKAKAFDFFLPSEAISVPFLSLFKQFRNHPDLNDIEPLLEGHIHYYNADSNLNSPDIYADLKWSNDSQSRSRVKALLTQICLQTATELVSEGAASINWKFSFPTAFSAPQVDQFANIWEQIVKRCSELTGLKFPPPVRVTESVAAAHYFRHSQQAGTALSAVFIDIGSSTSDISVWQNDKLLWQISLRLAGRDIFLKYLKNHLGVLQKFGLDTTRLDSMKSVNDIVKIWAETDALLHTHSDEIFRNLPLQAADDNIKKLRQHLALGLSGLIFYIGLGIHYLINKGLFTQQIPGIFVGGNGSQMFRWLNDGNTTINNSVAELFQLIFKKALDGTLEGSVKLELSKSPKMEAAYGLVCQNVLDSTAGHLTDVLAGESFIHNNLKYDWDTVITPESFAEDLQPPQNLDQISTFVTTFNNFAEKNRDFFDPITWDQPLMDSIRGTVANDLRNAASQNAVNVEPVFIIALRNLLVLNAER